MDEPDYAWIESESESRGVSMAQVIRDLIAAVRGNESPYDSLSDGDTGSDSVSDSQVIQRLDELEARLATVERRTEWIDPDPDPDEGEARGPGGFTDAADGGSGVVEAAVEANAQQDSDTAPSNGATKDTNEGGPSVAVTEAAPETDVQERARWALEATDQQATPDRVGALAAVIAYARDEGSLTMRDALEHVMLKFPAGYDTAAAEEYLAGERDRYRGGWWRSLVKPALEELPEIESPQRGGSRWRWVGKE